MIKSRNPERIIVKATLLAASMVTILGGAVLAPALPAIRNQFADVANVDYLTRFVLTLPAIFIAANAPVAGYIVDRFGRMNVLIVSLILAGLAGTSGYIAPTLTTILIGRVFLGLAVAGIMTGATTLIADYYTGEARANFLGIQTGFMGIAATLMLILAGILADVSWRLPFLIHLAAFIVLPFVLLFLYEPQHEDRCQGDHPPVGEAGTCAGESAHRRSGTPATAFPEEALPIRLIVFIYSMILLVQIIFHVILIQLPFYLKELTGATAAQSAFAISFTTLSFALSSIFLGKVMARRDHLSVLIASFVVVGLGYNLIFLTGATIGLYIGLVIAGVGFGILVPNMYVWLANETPLAYRGRILGGFTTAVFAGQFLSPILSQPVIDIYDIGRTILISGIVLVVLVPFVFAGRQRLRTLTA